MSTGPVQAGRPKNYDKYVTRMARMGHTSILMFGRRWPLEKDKYYRVRMNNTYPSASTIEEVIA